MLLIHGWSCGGEHYKYQIDTFKNEYRVIAVDLRNHGDSDKTAYGTDIARMAADVHELIVGLDLHDVALGGHSMGCSIIWQMFELYGSERIAKYILIDEDPMLTTLPNWTEDEKKNYGGSLFTGQSIVDVWGQIHGEGGSDVRHGLLSSLYNKDVSKEILKWSRDISDKADHKDMADLILQHATNDWSRVIPLLDRPTIVFGGKISGCSYKSMEWVGSVIKDSEVHIFEAEESGTHFMFIENYELFNKYLLDFLKK